MPKKNPEVDTYIAQAAPFARPILKRLRKAFHRGCPEIEEKIKWGVPYFDFQGPVVGMAAFKQHVSFGFWKSKLMEDPAGILGDDPAASMCNTKIRTVDELPDEDVLVAYVVQAVKLNIEGKKLPKNKGAAKVAPDVPNDLARALRSNSAAKKTFEKFSPSHQREYIEWINEAKQQTTRERRLVSAIEWMSAGKSRNWKYESKK